MSLDLTDDKSTLIQVMACCRQDFLVQMASNAENAHCALWVPWVSRWLFILSVNCLQQMRNPCYAKTTRVNERVLTKQAQLECSICSCGLMCQNSLRPSGAYIRPQPIQCQAINCVNAVLLPIGPLGTNFSQLLFEIQIFSIKKMRLKMSSEKMPAILSRSQCVKRNCPARYVITWAWTIDASYIEKCIVCFIISISYLIVI